MLELESPWADFELRIELVYIPVEDPILHYCDLGLFKDTLHFISKKHHGLQQE